MAQIIQVFPELPAHLQSITLGETQFSLRLTWRERTRAWYVDLLAANGTPIMQGQRVSPGWAIGAGLRPVGRPDGVLLIRGPAVYNREDLGGTVELVFYPTNELPLPLAPAYPVTVSA